MKDVVDIAVACSGMQSPDWWSPIMGQLLREVDRGLEIGAILTISSALPDHNKNHTIGGGIVCRGIAPAEEKGRNEKTDANRAEIANRFLSGNADWLFSIDDDTVFEDGAITKLLTHRKEAVAGLYFNPKHPYNPIAYVRRKDDIGYDALYGYPYGALMPVDSVGMGCTLVHRSVFERIMQEHEVFVRPNGSLIALHKSQIYFPGKRFKGRQEVYKEGDWLYMRLQKPGADDNRPWPFFAMEYGRTEDHHFWELAANIGVRPWVDTAIVCQHWKMKAATYEDYKAEILRREGLA